MKLGLEAGESTLELAEEGCASVALVREIADGIGLELT